MTTFSGASPESEAGIGALTIGGLLEESAARHRHREAVVFHPPDTSAALRWSYDELERQSHLIAKALLAAGVTKGTRVALLMGNRPEWVACAFGVASVGGVLVPLNTYFEPRELSHVLGHSDAALLLAQRGLARHDYAGTIDELQPRLPYLRRVVYLGTASWNEFLDGAGTVTDDRREACAAAISPYDDALVIYTSGTTAVPKGVLHAHRPPTLQSWRFAKQLCLDQNVRTWSAFPFFWTAGWCMVMGATLAAGGCLVLQEHFEPGEALRLLETERVTSPHAWPHQLAALEDHGDWSRRDLSAIHHVDPATSFSRHPRVRSTSVWSARAAYGLTETFTIVSSLPADTPFADRFESQGEILPGNLVRVLDPSTGAPLAPNELGEIAVKGTTLMRGYLKVSPEDCFDDDGFFRTGDAGFVDERNLLHWTGRTTDMIKTGGANVSPVEIEEALLYHPDLAVTRAVGVPDSLMGEIVVLCAVAHENTTLDEGGVREFLRGRVASYKIPRRVLFFSEKELPVTGNAKVRTEELRVLATSRLQTSPSGPSA